MPEKKTIERAKKAKAEGKAPSTQAGEFVREEIHHVREGKHGARSAKQAVAIGLSKARRAGVEMPVPEKGTVPERTRVQAKRASRAGAAAKKKTGKARRPNPKRSAAAKRALKREPTTAASSRALGRQAHSAGMRRRKRSATPRRRTKKASAAA